MWHGQWEMKIYFPFFKWTWSQRNILKSRKDSFEINDKLKLSTLSRVWVTINGDWIGDSNYRQLTLSRLVTTLYRWLTHTGSCPQSVAVSTSRFLATDFNTQCVTVSLNYTLQISHLKSSLHSQTFNWAVLQPTSCPRPSQLFYLARPHRKQHSSVAVPVLLLCLLLRDLV
jgi:hypothetical protein